MIQLDRWRTPASAYPRTWSGKARIKTMWYEPAFYATYGVHDCDYVEATRRLYVTVLQIDGKTWMVDDPPHWWAMEEHATFYRGRVLCAGLGLGLMVHTLTANREVSEIIVVERERDVIDLVAPLLPQEKLTVLEADFYDVGPADVGEVDGVFFDLLVGKGHQMLGEAIQALAFVFCRWDHPGFVGRIHGFDNAGLEPVARAVAQTKGNFTLEIAQNAESAPPEQVRTPRL